MIIIKLNKELINKLFFALCIAVPMLNIYELTFFIWILGVFITLKKSYSKTILIQIICLSSIVLISMIVFFFKSHELYFVIRDITYLLKPILGILFGYQIFKNTKIKVFEVIIYTSLFIGIIHIIILIYAFTILNAHSVNDLRFYGGYFSDFEVYAFIILLFNKKFDLSFAKKTIILYGSIVFFSVCMYMARTNFIQIIILIIALKGYFVLNKKSLKVIITLLISVIIGYSLIVYSNPKRNGKGIEALLYKIKIAPTEAFKTKINREDWKDFNDNYRSYENIMTIREAKIKGFNSIVFGQGLGSKVNLRQKVMLGDQELKYIPFLHNGFMTVFLKSGLIGLFIYLYSIMLIGKKFKSNIKLIQSINLLLLGTSIFLIFSNWVFLGVYNLLDNKSILIGLLICNRERIFSLNNNLKNKND